MIDQQAIELKSYAQILRNENKDSVSASYADQVNAPPPSINVDTGQVIGELLSVTFGMIAAKKGDHWALQAEESKLAGEAYGAVIDKHYPDAGKNLGVETTALLITGMIFTPRLIIDSKNKKLPAAMAEENVSVDSSTTAFQGIKTEVTEENGD